MSLPFIFSPLFVLPSVFSSHPLFKLQLQSSIFLPSICLVIAPHCTVSLPPIRLHTSKIPGRGQGCAARDLERTKCISTNQQQLQVILGTKQSPQMNRVLAKHTRCMEGERQRGARPLGRHSHETRFTKGREMYRSGMLPVFSSQENAEHTPTFCDSAV